MIRLANFGETPNTKFNINPFSSFGGETRDRSGKSSPQWVHVHFVHTKHNVVNFVTTLLFIITLMLPFQLGLYSSFT